MLFHFIKRIIKKINTYFYKNAPILKPKKFIKWWTRYCLENSLDENLVKMINDYISTKSY